MKLEEERQALAAFVSKFDALGLGSLAVPQTKLPLHLFPVPCRLHLRN